MGEQEAQRRVVEAAKNLLREVDLANGRGLVDEHAGDRHFINKYAERLRHALAWLDDAQPTTEKE